MTIQAFRSRVDDPASRRFGTFSYLPPLSSEEIARQVAYALSRGWTCAVEHVEPARAGKTFWYLWKLPMFDALDAADVLAEADACSAAHPGDLVRVVAHDRRRQTQALAFVVHRGSDPGQPEGEAEAEGRAG
ncbi:MAG TPA: ribulose bisphosphate carboxylase small subunit [Actinomycetes bacterium]|nr:ribulose bisphosphate carboxylase small subunit [Actinomycetes bacterium]